MKLFKQFNSISLFLILFLLVPGEVFAGDIKIKGFFWFQKAMKGREQPLLSTIENIESYPVEGANFKLTIKYKMSAEIEYEWSKNLGTVPAKSSTTIEADTPWIPQQKGTYTFLYELNSQNDINPSNDTSSFDVEVINPYYWIHFGFSQYNFINPFQQENSNTGSVDFSVVASGMPLYANFMVSPDDTTAHAEWLVQNVILDSKADTDMISNWLDLERIGFENGMDVKYLWYDFKITPEPISEPFISTGLYFGKVGDLDYNIGGDVPLEWEYPRIEYIPQIDWDNGFMVKTWEYRGCEVANIDLDSSKYNPREMAGEVGDWNCCAPASQVNSIQWLEDKNLIPKTNTTLREKLKIFNKLSKRENERGLNTGNTIKGKLAMIDSLKLPLRVKWQGVPYDSVIASPNPTFKHSAKSHNDSVGANCTFDWLASEVKNKEDVEIKFGWYDSTGERHSGHWVVVSGVSDVGTAQGLYVKDDQDQSKAGGTRQTYVNWVTNDEGRPRLVGFKAVNNYCWVESVVSESYDSTITFPPEIPEKIKNIKIEKLIPANSFSDEFYQLGFGSKMLFSYESIPDTANKFLNVKIRNKDSGDIIWAIKNCLIAAQDSTEDFSDWFSLDGYELKSNAANVLEYDYLVSNNVKSENELNLINWTEITLTETKFAKYLNTDDTDVSGEMSNAIVLKPGEDLGDLLARTSINTLNIDLDSSLFPMTNEYAGDKNAGAPAAATNGLESLENNFPEINSNLTMREKLYELSKMMKRDNNGVTRTNFIKAKLDFIDKYKLPIQVKFQSWKLGTDSILSPNSLYGHFAENKAVKNLPRPDWNWMLQAMKNKENIEMEIGYYNSEGKRIGSHWISVSGLVEFEKRKGIYFNDDLNQLQENGTKQQYVTWDTAWTYSYIRELSSETVTCYVETIVTESYDEKITFIPQRSEDISTNNKLNLKVYENPSSSLKPLTISFDVVEPGNVNLFIYEITGKLIYSEEMDYSNTGNKTVNWNGKGNKGVQIGNGTYIVKIKTHNLESTTKIIRMD